MNLVLITPGAGGMYCGNCFRDNALAAALRQAGHATLLVPLYLPLKLDEPDQSAGTPIFFSGINVYFDQKSALFRKAPAWLHQLLASPTLLKWASGRAAKTRAQDVGDLMLSMLRGEEGNQARELNDLIAWLKTQPKPDAICLSNALLIGMARQFKAELQTPVVCLLSGEDTFLDSLPASVRETAWRILIERCREVDLFLAPSCYFGDLMTKRLSLRSEQMRVLPNGINLEGYRGLRASVADVRSRSAAVDAEDRLLPAPSPLTLGYFARMCREKGLDTLVDAYLLLKRRDWAEALRLRVGGGCGPNDRPFVEDQRRKLANAGVLDGAQFLPNVDYASKLAFFQGLSVFSVPARYGEAFGLYVIEALAAGVPVVQPRHAAFPELIAATGGGVLCEPGNPKLLADAIESLLCDPERARELGARGRKAVFNEFSIGRMAENFVQALPPTK